MGHRRGDSDFGDRDMEAQILRERDVRALLGVSKVTLWRWRRAGNFPAPIRLGPNVIAWRRADVDEWLASRPLVTGEAAA